MVGGSLQGCYLSSTNGWSWVLIERAAVAGNKAYTQEPSRQRVTGVCKKQPSVCAGAKQGPTRGSQAGHGQSTQRHMEWTKMLCLWHAAMLFLSSHHLSSFTLLSAAPINSHDNNNLSQIQNASSSVPGFVLSSIHSSVNFFICYSNRIYRILPIVGSCIRFWGQNDEQNRHMLCPSREVREVRGQEWVEQSGE